MTMLVVLQFNAVVLTLLSVMVKPEPLLRALVKFRSTNRLKITVCINCETSSTI